MMKKQAWLNLEASDHQFVTVHSFVPLHVPHPPDNERGEVKKVGGQMKITVHLTDKDQTLELASRDWRT